jgi:hypothetical protein
MNQHHPFLSGAIAIDQYLPDFDYLISEHHQYRWTHLVHMQRHTHDICSTLHSLSTSYTASDIYKALSSPLQSFISSTGRSYA